MNKLDQMLRVYQASFEPGPSTDKNIENGSTVVDNRFFFFKKKGRFEKVDINSIIYIQAESNYTYTITEEGKYINTSNLSQMEELFSEFNFMRVHRSYLVNLDNLTSIDLANNKIFLGNHEVPFSRTMKDELTKRFNLIR